MRRAAKIDANQPEIVAALEAAGCLVKSLAAVGDGIPDLLVQRAGVLYLLEVKRPVKDPARLLTTLQKQRLLEGWQFQVVTHPFEALSAVGVRRGY